MTILRFRVFIISCFRDEKRFSFLRDLARMWYNPDRKYAVEMTMRFTILLMLLAIFAIPQLALAADTAPPAVGWSIDFSNPAVVAALPPVVFYDGKSRQNVQGRSSAAQVEKALRINALYGWGTKNYGDYVRLELPLPTAVDLAKYPMIEVEWRTDVPRSSECLEITGQTQTGSADVSSSSFFASGGKPSEWVTSIYQFVPDVSNPTRGTPTKLTGLALRTVAGASVGEYWVEIRAIRVRAMTEAEATTDTRHEVEFKDALKNASTRKPIATKYFPFGWAGVCRGPEGLESWYDTVVRHHANYSAYHYSQFDDWHGWGEILPVEDYISFRKKELAPAVARGLYIQPVLPLAGVIKDKGPENLTWVEGYTQSLAEAFRNEPYLAGWTVADEATDDWLWGVAGVVDALSQADPGKVAIANQYSINRMLRFEPYLGVLMTEIYPIRKTGRDPWIVGPWCREVSKKSDKPHWVFLQAMGGADWFSTDTDFEMPTRPEIRLMSYLALANGAKGLSYYCYSMNDLYSASFSAIGNPLPLADPIAEDISTIGEKVAEIGPFLLDTKLLPRTSAWTPAMAKVEKGVSVGVRQSVRGTFLVVVNESITQAGSSAVYIAKDISSKGRAIYDLYTLRMVAKLGSRTFQTANLAPGDGRFYMVASPQQFQTVRRGILRNRALEILRMAELDRLVAQRWGVDTKAVDAQMKKATQRAEWGDVRSAEDAGTMSAGLFKDGADITECRNLLNEAKGALGMAYYEARTGYDKAVPGCEKLVSSLQAPEPDTVEALWFKFAGLQESFYLGKKEGLLDSLTQISEDAQNILDKVRAARTNKETPTSLSPPGEALPESSS